MRPGTLLLAVILCASTVRAAEVRFTLSPKTYMFSPKSTQHPNTEAFWTAYYQDIFWALLNSNEFILNH